MLVERLLRSDGALQIEVVHEGTEAKQRAMKAPASSSVMLSGTRMHEPSSAATCVRGCEATLPRRPRTAQPPVSRQAVIG